MRYPKHTNLVREQLEDLNFEVNDPDDKQFAFSIGNTDWKKTILVLS